MKITVAQLRRIIKEEVELMRLRKSIKESVRNILKENAGSNLEIVEFNLDSKGADDQSMRFELTGKLNGDEFVVQTMQGPTLPTDGHGKISGAIADIFLDELKDQYEATFDDEIQAKKAIITKMSETISEDELKDLENSLQPQD